MKVNFIGESKILWYKPTAEAYPAKGQKGVYATDDVKQEGEWCVSENAIGILKLLKTPL